MALAESELAVRDFTAVLQLSPERVEAYMKRGDLRRASKNYKDAITDFSEVIAREPDNLEAYRKRGTVYLEAGNKVGAIDDYIRIIQLGGSQEDNDKPYLQALAGHPKMANVYFERGILYRYVYDWDTYLDEAAQNFSRALQVNPNFTSAYYHRGLSRLEMHPPALAINDFNWALAARPTDADIYFSRAQARFQAKDYAGAIDDFTKVLQLSPEMPDTYYQRGLVYSALRQWHSAISDFAESIRLGAKVPAAYYQRAIAHAQSGDTAGAIADYVQVVEKTVSKEQGEEVASPSVNDRAAVSYFRGLARFHLGLTSAFESEEHKDNDRNSYFDGAVTDFSKVIELQPNLAEAYYQRARAQLSAIDVSGDAKEKLIRLVQADLDHAISIKPSFAQAYLKRGLIYCSQKQTEKCIAELSKAIQFQPDWAKPYYERGHAYAELDRADNTHALADYSRAIDLYPDYLAAYRQRSIGRLYAKDLPGEMADLTELIRLDPQNVETYRRRGEVRLELKDYRGAVEDFTHAIELHPGEVGGLDHAASGTYHDRGYARFELGDGRGAFEDYVWSTRVDTCPHCQSGSLPAATADKADSFYEKGLSFSLRGDKSSAKDNFEQAAKLYRTGGKMKRHQLAKYQISRL
ncbi:MAG TPA: hypothetical protein DC054_01690 [Blastocatellia bacterium]|nr:hypothetical protein [Blastocatellia bacterium]